MSSESDSEQEELGKCNICGYNVYEIDLAQCDCYPSNDHYLCETCFNDSPGVQRYAVILCPDAKTKDQRRVEELEEENEKFKEQNEKLKVESG